MHSFFLRCLKNGFLKKPLPACIRYNRSVHSGHMYGSRLSFLFDAATAEISTTLPSSAGSRTYALSIRIHLAFVDFPRICRDCCGKCKPLWNPRLRREALLYLPFWFSVQPRQCGDYLCTYCLLKGPCQCRASRAPTGHPSSLRLSQLCESREKA